MMFNGLRDRHDLRDLAEKLNLRLLLLMMLICAAGAGLLGRIYYLQIIHGQSYLDNFQLRIRREIDIPATRGNIYDRNGEVLAYNEQVSSVTIRDLGENSTEHQDDINAAINTVLDILERNGDALSCRFDIDLDEQTDTYVFLAQGRALNRFLADVSGNADIDDMTYEQSTRSAQEVVYLLARNYHIGSSETNTDGTQTFVPGLGYSHKRLLDVVNVRYNLSLNSYQRYLSTTIASDVSERTIAAILENAGELEGVEITDETVRRYADSKYFAHLLGYTGRISPSELLEHPSYDASDTIGKSGIEKACDEQLQGKKGLRAVYVDSFGKELDSEGIIAPVPGNNVYLTIDKDLTMTAYDILEKKLSEIILGKIQPVKEYIPEEDDTSANIIIPIYDVYYAPVRNHLIDLSRFASPDATDTEKVVQAAFEQYQQEVVQGLGRQYREEQAPYNTLSREYKNYQTYLVQKLKDRDILRMDLVDRADEVYRAWTEEETISMTAFLQAAVARGWVDASGLGIQDRYVRSDEVIDALWTYLEEIIRTDNEFAVMMYKYMLLNDRISGYQICRILLDQGIVSVTRKEERNLLEGEESSYQFMINRIRNLDLTPAQLNLDPYSGSMVITDVNSGDVLAMVTYPGYDNNKMANYVDAAYYEQLRNDLSKPLYNYATQQLTAPGSTFKMVTATAGLMEGVITTDSQIACTGEFVHLDHPRCWIYPAGHGTLNLTGGIANSCNDFFYEVGWRLATVAEESVDEETGKTTRTTRYDSAAGVDRLSYYALLYGLGAKSGVEIEEAQPHITTEDAVRSSIGQADNNYTTAVLARYVTTVANSGTCYNLTLIDRVENPEGSVLLDNEAQIRNVINMDSAYWDAIHEGMKQVVEGFYYFWDTPVKVAGKTGTAQESLQRPNHALFVCYAPYERPQIAVATRVANGYVSEYAARITNEVLKYYFRSANRLEILGTNSNMPETSFGD